MWWAGRIELDSAAGVSRWRSRPGGGCRTYADGLFSRGRVVTGRGDAGRSDICAAGSGGRVEVGPGADGSLRAGCAGGSDMLVAGDKLSGEVGAGGRWSGGLPSGGPYPPASLCIRIRTYADIRTVRPLRKPPALI